MQKLFEKVSANPSNSKWENIIKRESALYSRNGDVRSDFESNYRVYCWNDR